MPVLIKRYANRKLYNTQTSRYITLKGIADLLESGEDVRVIDNETGEDITGVTLSQILVDTERSNRNASGTLLTGLFQRGGDALYEALTKGVDDASERLEEIQRNMRRLLRGRHERGESADWVAFTPPDLERVFQTAIERVFKALDLARRSDVDVLTARIDRLIDLLEAEPGRDPRGPVGSTERDEDPA
jgi:polyhydroxyalkanoate synthesis repressor PhaR